MKLPFSFSLKFVFRLLFPGFVLSLALFPATRALCDHLFPGIETSYVIILSTLLLGWLFILLDMQIYMALEGRRYWPGWLRQKLLVSEIRRLGRLKELYEKVKTRDRVKYIEVSVELRRFPLDERGEPQAIYPTRLGNLLAAYEQYPDTRYGMDSVFYWYRIWLMVDDDLREHLDSQQAVTDSAVYMTAAFFFAGLILLVYATIRTADVSLLSVLPSSSSLYLIGVVLLIISYLINRVSQHLHAVFGELYKSVFDVHRDKLPIDTLIKSIDVLNEDEQLKQASATRKYRAVWRYLHNYKVKTRKGVVSAAKASNSD